MFDLSTLNIKARTGIYATGQERVVQILETALDILIQDGFPAVTLREIARRSNIRVGAIHHYYRTRDDMILDLLAGVLNSYETLFESYREPSAASAEERLRGFIGEIMDDILTLKTTRLFLDLWALSNHNADVARMLDAIYIRSRAIITALIAQINPDLDLRTRETLAVFIAGSLEGMTVFAGHGKAWQAEMPRLKQMACDSLLSAVKAARPAPSAPDWRPPTLLDAQDYAKLTAADEQG